MFVKTTEAKMLAKFDESNPLMQDTLAQLASNSVHTLLEYPPGAHMDIFRGKEKEKIENKVVMTVKSKSSLKNDITLGRGGAGNGIFAYAIIDHPDSSEARRDIRQRRQYFVTYFPQLANLRVTN